MLLVGVKLLICDVSDILVQVEKQVASKLDQFEVGVCHIFCKYCALAVFTEHMIPMLTSGRIQIKL